MNAIENLSEMAHIEKARQRLLDRECDAMHRNVNLEKQATSDVETIIAMIIRCYRPRRIFQWGSLLRPGAFKPYSDIDIAIEGLTDAEQFFALLGQAQACARFPLDIVQLEKIAPEHAEDIRRYGKLVYERE